MIGTVCILVTVLIAMARTKELTPSDEELEEMRSAPKGLGAFVTEIKDAVRTMPVAMHKIGVVFLFQWYAMFIYWQFLAVSLGETVFNATPEEGGPAWDQAIAWSGLQNATYNFVCMVSALFLVGFAHRMGAKRVHAIALGLGAAGLIWLAQISNQYLALVPMIGLGIFWASAVGIPYLMVASMVPAKRTGVYMGILNMMIVVPMLVETVTFGWIFKHLLDSKGTNAITAGRCAHGMRRHLDALGQPAAGRTRSRRSCRSARHDTSSASTTRSSSVPTAHPRRSSRSATRPVSPTPPMRSWSWLPPTTEETPPAEWTRAAS